MRPRFQHPSGWVQMPCNFLFWTSQLGGWPHACLGNIISQGDSLEEEGNGSPLQYSCLGTSHRERNLAGYSPWGCKRVRHNWLTKHKHTHTHTHTHTHMHIYFELLSLNGRQPISFSLEWFYNLLAAVPNHSVPVGKSSFSMAPNEMKSRLANSPRKLKCKEG